MTVGWTCAFDDDTRRASAQSFAATTHGSSEAGSESHPKPQLTHPVILSEGWGSGGERRIAALSVKLRVDWRANPGVTMNCVRNEYDCYVYIMANRWKTIYTGVTAALESRVWQHKTKAEDGFTSRYGIDRLVYYEHTNSIHDAIAREKQIKGWRRAKKVILIESMNPGWKDLAAEYASPPE
jgi:putative endonuclease